MIIVAVTARERMITLVIVVVVVVLLLLGLQRVGKFPGKWKLSLEIFREFSRSGNFRNFEKYSHFLHLCLCVNMPIDFF